MNGNKAGQEEIDVLRVVEGPRNLFIQRDFLRYALSNSNDSHFLPFMNYAKKKHRSYDAMSESCRALARGKCQFRLEAHSLAVCCPSSNLIDT